MDFEALLQAVVLKLDPVLAEVGYELVERELAGGPGGHVLRLYIERAGESVEQPITVDDCEKAAKALSPILDVEDWFPEHYTLEVSSPGLDRPLRRSKDFERFSGSRVSLKTKRPIDGRSHFVGLLKGLKGNSVWLEIDGLEYTIPLDLLKKANVKYEYK